MVTDYSQVLAAAQPRVRAGVRLGLMVAFRRVGQALCGLKGHDNVLHFERSRFALECSSCGHVSPGWVLDGPSPQVRYAGDAARHQLRSRPRRVA